MPAEFLLIGDHPGADFLNTRAGVGDATREYIEDGAAFVRWLAAAGVLPEADVRSLPKNFSAAQLDQAARQARELREWVRGFLDRWSAATPAAKPVELRRKLQPLLDACVYRRVINVEEAPLLEWVPVIEQPAALVALVASIVVDLVVNEKPSSFKRCIGHGCSLSFVDRTKSQRRHYCSAALCGNRAKVAAFRARQGHAVSGS